MDVDLRQIDFWITQHGSSVFRLTNNVQCEGLTVLALAYLFMLKVWRRSLWNFKVLWTKHSRNNLNIVEKRSRASSYLSKSIFLSSIDTFLIILWWSLVNDWRFFVNPTNAESVKTNNSAFLRHDDQLKAAKIPINKKHEIIWIIFIDTAHQNKTSTTRKRLNSDLKGMRIGGRLAT